MLIFDVKLINNMGQNSTKKHVFLTGYMGSGKSTIGLLLSKQLSVSFIDLDAEIEKIEEMSIPEIFNKKGEDYFRIIESNMLNEIFRKPDDAVIALGGGSISNQNNLNNVLNDGILIYLEASTSILINRIKNEVNKRPLLAQYNTDHALLNYIESHLNSRLKNYQRSNYTINTDERKFDEIISEITEFLNSNVN